MPLSRMSGPIEGGNYRTSTPLEQGTASLLCSLKWSDVIMITVINRYWMSPLCRALSLAIKRSNSKNSLMEAQLLFQTYRSGTGVPPRFVNFPRREGKDGGGISPLPIENTLQLFFAAQPPLSPGLGELGDADSVWLNVDWLGSSGKGRWSWWKCLSSQPITAHSPISLPILLTLSIVFSHRTLLLFCLLYIKDYCIGLWYWWSPLNYHSPHFIKSPVRAPIPSVFSNWERFIHTFYKHTNRSLLLDVLGLYT